MAFWGVEVRPGRPYTHSYNPSHGRLRICQATLGSCDAATRTVVQCIVGNKTPVILCSLNPRLAEMCHLEIELEEDDEVLFSVLGQSTVHLSGYYLRPGSRRNAEEEESESYGEDVGESDDNDREYNESEDSYESDFIDDSDTAVPEENYASDSLDDGDVCTTPDRHKQAFEKNAGKVERPLRLKKYQADITEDNNVDSPYKPAVRRNALSIFNSGSEDEDDLPISVFLSKQNNAKASEEVTTENVEPNDETGKKSNDAKKIRSDSVSQDSAASIDVTMMNESSFIKQEEIKTENVEPNDETGKESNDARKTRSDSISQDPAAPIDVTVVNGSSFIKQEEIKTENVEPEKTSNDARKRKCVSSQDPASPIDATVVNGSSFTKQEAEVKKKSKKNKRTSLEGEDGKHSNNIRTLEDGLIIEDLSARGHQDAKVASDGSKVYIKFVCKLQDGKIIESNVEEEKPYKFKLGAGTVIGGWDIGIRGMRVGDKRRLTVPPSMRWGSKAVGKVAENSTIIYEVELLKVRQTKSASKA